MKKNNLHISDEKLPSLWDQTEDTSATGFVKQIRAQSFSAWAHSSAASALKTAIVRLAMCEIIKPEMAQALIKWLGLKHA